MHNGFVTVERRKMLKSLRNVLLVHDLLEHHDGQTIRLALLSAHYRPPLDWSDKLLTESGRALSRLKRLIADTASSDHDVCAVPTVRNRVAQALADDLNTPAAMTALFGIARELRHADLVAERSRLRCELVEAVTLLGLKHLSLPECLSQGTDKTSDAALAEMVARRRKDYQEADALRDALLVKGVVLDDTHDGTRWRRIH